MTAPEQPTRFADRFEAVVLVAIVIAVGAAAGAASFTHVKDWTLDNSPHGTGVWFGWANAVISELVPIAALLTIRRRRRTDAPIGYPIFLLLAAATLSLAAQLAVAKPGPSGWLLSAVPALAFMALAKLVLAPNLGLDAPSVVDNGHRVTAANHSGTAVAAGTDTAHADELVPAATSAHTPAHLIPPARFAAAQHEQHTGRPITADELATRLSLTAEQAAGLLTHIGTPATAPARVNGVPIAGGDR